MTKKKRTHPINLSLGELYAVMAAVALRVDDEDRARLEPIMRKLNRALAAMEKGR
jgi:hypothetical protein